jgi:hypothetical protein
LFKNIEINLQDVTIKVEYKSSTFFCVSITPKNMLKKLLIFPLCMLFVSPIFAQTSRAKQMQKLETRIDFEYITFADSAKKHWTKSTTKINLQDFNQSLVNASDVSLPVSLSVTEGGKLNFKNGISRYTINPQRGLLEDFSGIETDFRYLSSSEAKATILFRLNKQTFELDLTKDTVFLTPISKETFAAFRLASVKKQLAVCSFDEIFLEIRNKNNPNWIKKCYDAGSPELKIAE